MLNIYFMLKENIYTNYGFPFLFIPSFLRQAQDNRVGTVGVSGTYRIIIRGVSGRHQ